jgi:hypothetical protein
VVVVVPACVVVVAAPRLKLQHCLPPPLQGAVVDELHHHEHIGDDEVPAGRLQSRQNAACGLVGHLARYNVQAGSNNKL